MSSTSTVGRDEGGRFMDVVMLGPRGAGKTSLLVSLYDQFQDVVGDTPLELSTEDAVTRSVLERCRQQLRRFARGVDRDYGVEASTDIRQYVFGLGTRGKRPPQLRLRFTDFPGELLLVGSGSQRERLDAALARSGVLFVAVDAPALMERNGRYHGEVNTPELIMDSVRDTLGHAGSRLVVVVPLKCEKYVATPAGARQLAERVKTEYAPLIRHMTGLAAESAEQRSGAVLVPAQTVGSMHFSRFEEGPSGEVRREVFRVKRVPGVYAPQDTDQPLRWMLRFVVNAYKDRDKSFGERFLDWWTSTDLKLNEALTAFGSACKDHDGFEVLVRHPYLELP